MTSIDFLALGDSYTIGEGVEPSARWPIRLADALRRDGIVAAPRIIATTGWTTDELTAAIDAAEPVGRFDLVSLAIGVNNQYRDRSVEDYRAEFAELLRRALGFAGQAAERVFVLSIPDWSVTPFAEKSGRDQQAIAQEIDAFNEAAHDICVRQGVAFIDITPLSRMHGRVMLAEDGLHPSAAMYAEWMRLIYPVARDALSSSKIQKLN